MDLPFPKHPARSPHKAGKMNKMEAAYARVLDGDKKGGLILNWWFEPFGLRLGEKCFYHPDFLIQRADGVLEVHEVKGHWEDDARAKIKAAADKFPFVFKAVRQGRNGAWHDEFLTREGKGCASCRFFESGGVCFSPRCNFDHRCPVLVDANTKACQHFQPRKEEA